MVRVGGIMRRELQDNQVLEEVKIDKDLSN